MTSVEIEDLENQLNATDKQIIHIDQKISKKVEEFISEKDAGKKTRILARIDELEELQHQLEDEFSHFRQQLADTKRTIRRKALNDLRVNAAMDQTRASQVLASVQQLSRRPSRSGDPADKENPLSQVLNNVSSTNTGSIAKDATYVIDEAQLHEGTSKNDILGEGKFGIVKRGTYKGSEVAVKTFFADKLTEKDYSDFMNEVQIMNSFRHPNLLMILGASANGGKLRIVTELMSRSLRSALKDRALGFQQKITILKQVAMGLAWLHSLQPKPILHLDLKPENILLDKNNTAKIGDFGLSAIGAVADKRVGSPGYMSPEVIRGTGATPFSDVYSFGVLLWSTMTEKLPYENWKGNLQEFVDAIVTGLRPHTNTEWPNADTPEALTALYKRCVDSEPSRRQSFQTILLTGVFEEIILQDLFPKPLEKEREFWTKSFDNKAQVEWDLFRRGFLKWGSSIPSDISLSYLKAILCSQSKLYGGKKQIIYVVSVQDFSDLAMALGPSTSADHMLKKVESLASHAWFHGMISKEASENRLVQFKEKGGFLVRFSGTKRGEYVISFLSENNTVEHFRVQHSPSQGTFMLDQTTSYSSIVDLLRDSSILKKHHIYARHSCKGSDFERIRTQSQAKILASDQYIYNNKKDDLKDSGKKK